MKTCPACQQAYSDEIESCPRDGSRLATETRDERECPYCAEKILRKARVCKHCGHDVQPLAGTGIAVQAPPPATPANITETRSPQPQASSPAAAVDRPPTTAKPPWLRSAQEPPGKMRFVAIAVVALILIVAGVWYFLQRGPKKGEVRVNPNDGLKYVWIPPRMFQMGCSPGDTECGNDEKPPHQVTITKGFWLGQAEVTVGAYKRFAAATGRQMPPEPVWLLNPGWGNEAMPIVDVTWDDAQSYCKWTGGRLPTEAEWEYAARAGSTAPRYGDLDEIAWYEDNSGRQHLDSKRIFDEGESEFNKRKTENGNNMHEVSQKRANAFGLYDMLGNVWEWVNDWYGEKYYQSSPTQDPVGPTGGTLRVVRGGSWFDLSSVARASDRFGYDPSTTFFNLGFRCVGEAFAPLKAADIAITKAEDDRHGSPSQTNTTGSDLTVVDWQLTSCGDGSRCIVGTVRNNSDEEFSRVFVHFNLYDSNGTQVGSTNAYVNNLEAHGIWKFKAFAKGNEVATARLKDVTGQ